MNITLPEIKVAGFYTFFLNGVEVFPEPSQNLITDFGWVRLLNMTTVPMSGAVLQVGTGNTPPVASDTALVALLASKTGAGDAVPTNGADTIGTYRGKRYSFAFAQGAVVGNVAEVGFKVATADGSLTSRSLTKDGLGNPAVIVVTAIDVLTVVYELRYYLNRTLSVSGTTSVAGTPTNWTLMAAADNIGMDIANAVIGYKPVSTFNFTYGTGFSMGAVGTDPTGPSSSSTRTLTGVTVNSTLGTVTYTLPFGTGDANQSGGLFGLLIYQHMETNSAMANLGKYKISFSPPIPKDNTKTLAFNITLTFTRL